MQGWLHAKKGPRDLRANTPTSPTNLPSETEQLVVLVEIHVGQKICLFVVAPTLQTVWLRYRIGFVDFSVVSRILKPSSLC